jgi:hypothetical protein
MSIPSFIVFILTLIAAYLVPGWGLAPSLLPYVFIVALILVWGVHRHAIEAAVTYALMFEIFLGGHLGVLPLATLTAVLAYGFLRRLVTLKPLTQERWGLGEMSITLMIGMVLGMLMIAVSWVVLELVYRISYPFPALLAQVRDIRLGIATLVELGVIVFSMYSLHEYFFRKRI